MRPLSIFAPRSFAVAPGFPLLALALVLASAPANAITVEINGGTTYQFGLDACTAGTSVDLTYALSGTLYTNPVVSAFSTADATCTAPTTSTSGTTYAIPSQTATTGTIPVPLAGLLFGTACSASTTTAANPGIVYVCMTVTANAVVEETGSVEVEYAMLAPDPPTEASIVVQSGDAQLHVSWTPVSTTNIASYQVYCEADQAADGGPPDFIEGKYSAQATSGNSATVSFIGSDGQALVDGDSYSIAISTTDTFGNESPLSGISPGHIPYPVDDFYDYYREQGGSALGCASSDGVTWAALAGAALWIFFRARRRSKRVRAGGTVALVIGLSLFGAASAAQAEDIDYSPSNFSTPTVRPERKFFFGLELDRYKPQVDSEKDLDGNTPYKDIFGHRVPWRVQGEFAWEVTHFRNYGSLLVGGSVGFWQNIGKGIYATCAVLTECPNHGQTSSDTTLLDIWPFGIEGQWRFDMIADRIRWFPLIPYVKAGLMAGLWTVYSGNGDIANSPAVSASPGTPARSAGHGQGWTTGYTTALGAAISLDAIDPGVSNEAYLDLGLQRTSVFAEYGWTRLDGFQSGGVMILTDRGWRFGMSLEF